MNSVNNITPSSIAQEQLEAKRAENPKEVRGLSAQEEKLLALRQEFGERKKDTFVMYEPYYKHIKAVMKKENFVSDEAQFFECLCEYGLYEKEPSDNLEDNALFDLFWEDCKRQIDKSREKDKTKTKEGFTFWRTFYNAIYEDTPTNNPEWLTLFNIYCLYGFDMAEPEPEELQSLNKIARKCWAMDKPHFVANWTKVYNGNKGGRPKPTHNQPITKDNQPLTKDNQPLSNKNKNKNENINEKENENENSNEVASSSLSQDNFSSSPTPTPTLQDIEDYILSQEDIFVYPGRFYYHYAESDAPFPKDWKAKLRIWSDNERDKQGAKEELRYLRNQRENIEIHKLYSALYEKYKEPLYSDGISKSLRNEIMIKYDVYKSLHKKGVPDQQILDTILLLIEMKHYPFIPNFCELSQFILNIDRVRKYWKLSKPLYEEFIATLKKEGIDERVISYADTSFYCREYWQMKRKGINTDLIYKAVREANKSPESLNYKYALYDILENVIKADQAKAEQEENQADDEAQDIE